MVAWSWVARSTPDTGVYPWLGRQTVVGHLGFDTVTARSRLLWERWCPYRAVTVALPAALCVTVTITVVLVEKLTALIPWLVTDPKEKS